MSFLFLSYLSSFPLSLFFSYFSPSFYLHKFCNRRSSYVRLFIRHLFCVICYVVLYSQQIMSTSFLSSNIRSCLRRTFSALHSNESKVLTGSNQMYPFLPPLVRHTLFVLLVSVSPPKNIPY